MRICLYTETALPMVGGQELVVDALARQFLARGHEVVVLTLQQRHGQSDGGPLLPYPVVRHRRYFSTRHFLDSYAGHLTTAYRDHRFDVLHAHNVYPAGYIAMRWSEPRGMPLVITSHGCDIAPESCLMAKPQVPDRVAYVLSHASTLVSINDSVERNYRRHCPAANHIVSIPNGVDLAAFSAPVPRPPTVPDGLRPGEYFLFLGRLIHRKGGDQLLVALRQIADDIPVQLVIAGTGEEEPALKSQAAALGLAERVHFTGVVQGMEKTYLLQNCLGTVIPSRISEAASLVVLESYAAGVPVIGTAIPGLVTTIVHNETGLLVTADAPAELGAAMTRLARDRGLARRLGRGGRRKAKDFDWGHIADRHLKVYASLLRRKVRVHVA
jgi:glycosyltransferase involved in cell wall biosynthesis